MREAEPEVVEEWKWMEAGVQGEAPQWLGALLGRKTA